MISTLLGNQIKVVREWGDTVMSLGYGRALLSAHNQLKVT